MRDSDARERRDAYVRIVESVDVRGEPRIVLTHRSRTREPARLGVLAASFNPPTLAHVRMAELARDEFGCDEVLLELAKSNVDKDIEGAPLHERLMMLRELCASRDRLSVAVGSHGRFLDKATAIRREYPSAEIVFIVGYDTLVRVFDAKYYANRDAELEALFGRASFLCANRAGDGVDGIEGRLDLPENRPFRARVGVMPLDSTNAARSSTSARERLARGDTCHEDLPSEVSRYILANALYRS